MTRQKFREAVRDLTDFKFVGLALLIFIVVNTIVYYLITQHHLSIENLWLSANRPWGIVSAAFAHLKMGHFSGNMTVFLWFCICFIAANCYRSAEWRKYSGRIFLVVAFSSGFLVNSIEYFYSRLPSGLTNVGTWGASGVVYAALGILLASASYCLIANTLRLTKGDKLDWNPRIQLILWGVVTPLLLTLASFLMIPTGNVPGTSAYGHVGGFLFGFSISLGMLYNLFVRELKEAGICR